MINEQTEMAGQIAPVSEQDGMMPIANIGQLAKVVQAFNEIKTQIILQDKTNYIESVDRRTGHKRIFLKRSAWRQVQLAYHLSDEISKEEELMDPTDPKVYGYKIWARVYRGNKSVIGVAMCWSNEPNKTFPHGRHDVYATAHTRAKNRAISDFVGSGEVSAEEMDTLDHHPSTPAADSQPTKSTTTEELCSCGHQLRLHGGSLSGEMTCMVGTKGGQQCVCEGKAK